MEEEVYPAKRVAVKLEDRGAGNVSRVEMQWNAQVP
jgi:hypothetical protein